MSIHHKDVPHYGSALVDDAREAHKLLATIKKDPTALSHDSRAQDQHYQSGLPDQPKVIPEIKPQGKA